MSGIGSKIARGAAWMIAFRLTDRAIGVASTVVLARLLVPNDFGLVAMAASIAAALTLLGAFSFDLALIQNQQAERRHYDTVWTFNVVVGLASGLILAGLAWPAAWFYQEPRLSSVVLALAVSAVIGGIGNVGVVAFRKELTFDREFRFLIWPRLAAFVVTLICAIIWRSYWALVVGTIAGRSATVVASYVVHPYRPRLSLAASRELFHFSKWLFVNNVLFFLNNRSSDFIVGKLAGTHGLGVYGLASEIATLPTTELSAPIQRAVYPGYASMAGDTTTLRQGFLSVMSGSALLLLPAATGIAIVAAPLVQVMLGPKWIEAIPIIRILAFYGLATAFAGTTGYVHVALGRPKTVSLITGIVAAILCPLLVFTTSRFGIAGTAWAQLCVLSIGLVMSYVPLMRSLRLSYADLWLAIWRPLVAVVAMTAVVEGLQTWFLSMDGRARLAVLVAAGAVSYVTTVLVLWQLSSRPRGAESFILDRLRVLVSR